MLFLLQAVATSMYLQTILSLKFQAKNRSHYPVLSSASAPLNFKCFSFVVVKSLKVNFFSTFYQFDFCLTINNRTSIQHFYFTFFDIKNLDLFQHCFNKFRRAKKWVIEGRDRLKKNRELNLAPRRLLQTTSIFFLAISPLISRSVMLTAALICLVLKHLKQ